MRPSLGGLGPPAAAAVLLACPWAVFARHMLGANARACAVYCRGPLLDAVQRAGLFPDSKHFVDMPLRRDPEEVLGAFGRLPADARRDPHRLMAFVQEFFHEPGSELQPCGPEAHGPESPPFLQRGGLHDEGLRDFALALHRLWPTLCRVAAPSVADHPQRTSALFRKHPMILPGGRFRETYYWDSYWIVQGLLASGNLPTAQGLVRNLLADVDAFGFVPNGGRVYYLSRSQPPFLHAMVSEVAGRMEAGDAAAWLREALPTLKKEYEWWMGAAAGHAVQVGDFTLNRFHAETQEPRPESYREDLQTCAGRGEVCRQVASVAETGWDFSSRWAPATRGAFHVNASEVTRILPVDLNAIMYNFERTLAAMSEAVALRRPLPDVRGRPSYADPQAAAFAEAAARRRKAFNALFWQGDLGRWVDVWLPEAAATSAAEVPKVGFRAVMGARQAAPWTTLADFAAPLWADLATPQQVDKSIAAFKRSGLFGPGGAATTTDASGQQWDRPNAWAPLQSMLIDGLQAHGGAAGADLALDLARVWVGTCHAAWRSSGFMYEKYDAMKFGHGGDGGEYEPQVGFGWSNGVVLRLLEQYGDRLLYGRGSVLAALRRPAEPLASQPWQTATFHLMM